MARRACPPSPAREVRLALPSEPKATYLFPKTVAKLGSRNIRSAMTSQASLAHQRHYVSHPTRRVKSQHSTCRAHLSSSTRLKAKYSPLNPAPLLSTGCLCQE